MPYNMVALCGTAARGQQQPQPHHTLLMEAHREAVVETTYKPKSYTELSAFTMISRTYETNGKFHDT